MELRMTKEEIIKMAKQANAMFDHVTWVERDLLPVFERLTKLVAEKEYERGFIDGMQKQMQSSVDKAVNAMTKPTYYIPSKDQREWVGKPVAWDMETVKIDASAPLVMTPHFAFQKQTWVGLTDDEVQYIADSEYEETFVRLVEAKLKEKNT
jgi:hypothetical protein